MRSRNSWRPTCAARAAGRLEDGLLAESRKDFKRNAYTIGGERQPLDESAVTAALHAFCTDPGGKPNERLLKNVSMLAYQAGPGCMYGSVLNAQRADIAVFDATPSVISDEQSYEVWREDSGNGRGDVLVKCLQSGAVGFMQRRESAAALRPTPSSSIPRKAICASPSPSGSMRRPASPGLRRRRSATP